jgi:hypothetical protein
MLSEYRGYLNNAVVLLEEIAVRLKNRDQPHFSSSFLPSHVIKIAKTSAILSRFMSPIIMRLYR